jgi:hypothetical protein
MTGIVVAQDALGNTLSFRRGKVLRTWGAGRHRRGAGESVPERIDRTFTYAQADPPRGQESLPLKCVTEI